MAVIETWFEQDLQQPVKVHYLDGSLFSHNGNGNRIGVKVYNNGEAVTLSGTVSGYVVTADGSTVPCTGTRSGNMVSILIPAAAYQPGTVFITVFLTDGTTVTTLCSVATSVLQARTGNQVSPGSVTTDWTNTINAAMQAVVDANAANMAETYDSLSFPVPLGKYCLYNDNLYRCISPIASSETWTASHWTQVKIADEVSDLKGALETITSNDIISSWVNGYNLSTSGATVDFSAPIQAASMRYAKIHCNAGDIFTVSARGATAARAWAFTDENGAVLTRADAGTTVENFEITAPSNGYLVINDYKENGVFVRISYTGSLLARVATRIRKDLDSRSLVEKKILTSIPIKGGSFTDLYPTSSTTPYYIGGFDSRYAEFDCMINEEQSDFWLGVQVNGNSNMEFIGLNMRRLDDGRLRKIANNSTNTTILNTDTSRTLFPVGQSRIIAEVDDRNFRVYCNDVLYADTIIPVGYLIKGIAILNFGIVQGNISNLSVCETLESISSKIVENDYITLTDSVITEKGWTSFKDFTTNKAYSLNLSASNYLALGLPVARAGTLLCLRPYDLGSTQYSYRIYLYVYNDAYEFVHGYLCFGHGQNVTPWASIDTYDGAGYKNPLAEAVLDNTNKVCFIGDSIVAGLGGTGYDVSETGGGEYIMYRSFDRYSNVRGYCWVNEMIKHMTDVYGHTNAKNRGVGGISTQEILTNWETLLDGANTVILSCGTNDYNNLSRITTYLPQIAKECNLGGVKLMVMTNTPTNTVEKNKYNAVKGRIVAVCNAIGIPVYDMYSEFETYLELKGITLSEVLKDDGIHPNDTGYSIMFTIAKKLFQI